MKWPLLLFFGMVACSPPLPPVSELACFSDDECQMVSNACLECGGNAVLHVDEVSSFEDSLEQQWCRQTRFDDVLCDYGGRRAAACVENKCVFELYLFCGNYQSDGNELATLDSCPPDRTCNEDADYAPECVPALRVVDGTLQ